MDLPNHLFPNSPTANYQAHKNEINAAIARVLDSGRYILGREVAAFEEEFASYIGVRHAICVASGTDALYLALRACGIGSGDVVITVSHTAVATVAAIEMAGATPLLVDIDPITFTMDPNCLEDTVKKYKSNRLLVGRGCVKAVIPVYLYGHPADMPAIMEIARRYDLNVIEDCAQSHGASIQGRKTGARGDLSAFSFYPTKNLGALGDGGAVVSSDSELNEKVCLMREYGWRERYISELPGTNSRLDELQAAILRVKLQYLDKENNRRREIAHIYDTMLSASAIILPRLQGDVEHVYHQYVVLCKYRDSLRAFLKKNSVGTLIHYPVPIHLQPAYKDRVFMGIGGLKNTEILCREILGLPMYPQMTEEQTHKVSELIVRFGETDS